MTEKSVIKKQETKNQQEKRKKEIDRYLKSYTSSQKNHRYDDSPGYMRDL